MNKLILISFLLVCVGYALAGYGSGTPGYYDPWTYYGGYERYDRNYPRPYGRREYDPYPISGGGGRGMNRDRGSASAGNRRPQPQQQSRPFTTVSRYTSGGRGPYETSMNTAQPYSQQQGRSYNKASYWDNSDSMYDDDY